MMEKIWHWILTFLMVLGLLLFVNSCGSSRKSVSVADRASAAPLGSSGSWRSVSMPVSLDLDKPMSMSASGRATMVRDSLVHISIRFIGMEVAVVRATADSVFLVDKYHKMYFAEPLAALLGESGKGLTLGDIQDMMLGMRDVPAGAPATVTVGEVTETPVGPVAGLVGVSASTGKGDVEASLEWNLRGAKWNVVPLDVPSFSIPRGAKRLTMETLQNKLKSISF